MLRDHLRRCRALLFPGEEDFGIVPVEAQACGTPVIAFGRGGATETVDPWPRSRARPASGSTSSRVDCLIAALEQFEQACDGFDPQRLRTHALRFCAERFEAGDCSACRIGDGKEPESGGVIFLRAATARQRRMNPAFRAFSLQIAEISAEICQNLGVD